MTKFIIVYFGGDRPASEEEGQMHMAKYMQWLGSLGERAISPANPLKNSHTLTANAQPKESSNSGMSGYTIVETETIEEAVALAQDCPFLDLGGTLEVSELIRMPGMN